MSHIGSGAPPATMMDDQRMARGAGGGRVREGVQHKDPPTRWWYVGHSKGLPTQLMPKWLPDGMWWLTRSCGRFTGSG